MIILDSNVWIALFHTNDTQHRKAEELLKILKVPLILPEYVMIEVITVLLYKAGKSVANLFIERTMENKDIEVLPMDDEFFFNSLEHFTNIPAKTLSFVDVTLLILLNQYKIITFDATLNRQFESRDRRSKKGGLARLETLRKIRATSLSSSHHTK